MACEALPARYLLCIMLFFGFMATFLLRANLNLAIVAMVKSPVVAEDDLAGRGLGAHSRPCAPENASVPTHDSVRPRAQVLTQGDFEWDEFQQSLVLGSFFWGYLIFQVPGGRIAELHGTKRVYGAALFTNGLLCFVIPWAAKVHWTLLLLARALQGLAQGVVFPAMSAIVVRWVPVAERARFVSFAFQGASLGTVVALPLCGRVLSLWGWEAVFYVSGALTIAWTIAWWFLVFDSPDQHPRIGSKESDYLKQHLDPIKSEAPPIPWKEALRSRQLWLGNLAAVGSDWGFHTFFTLGPKYMKSALGFDLEQSSWLSSLPFFSQYVFAMMYGSLADLLLQKKISLVTVRKISVVVSHLLPAVGLLILPVSGCNVILSVVVLTLSITMIGAVTSGFFQTPMDIAPNFAGVFTGVMNGLGSTTPVVSTPLAGALLHYSGTFHGWKYIFFVAAGMYVIGAIPYLIFYKAQVEPWNSSDKKQSQPGDTLRLESSVAKDTVA